MNLKKLENFSKNIRKNIIYTAFKAGSKSAHIGGALSAVDLIAVLYSDIMKNKKKKFLDENRDRFILSKGHACLALYSALVEKKIIKKKDLESFESDGSKLLGHPIIDKLSGIEFSTGSLGMGLSLGVGVAIAAKKKNKKFKTFVILGDGECNEGSVWEAVMSANHFKLDNLVIIVDRNKLQQTGKSDDIMNLQNLKNKFKSFGCDTYEINGHDIKKIYSCLTIKNKENKPKAIIAKTVKGKGIKLFENNNSWHHSIITKKIYQSIIKEL